MAASEFVKFEQGAQASWPPQNAASRPGALRSGLRLRVDRAEKKTERECRAVLHAILRKVAGIQAHEKPAPQPKPLRLEVTLPDNVQPNQRLVVPFNGQRFTFAVPEQCVGGMKILIAIPSHLRQPPQLLPQRPGFRCAWRTS